MSTARKFIESISRFMPEVAKPTRRVSLAEKLVWTTLAMLIYLIMGEVYLYGVPRTQITEHIFILHVVFAQKTGTLTTLGIGPIVTAGILLQLLVGAEIIKLNLTKPEDRALFTSLSKILSLVVAAIQALAFSMGGMFGTITAVQVALIFIQLMIATFVIMMLDELIQRGWGLGSGISLFIAVGVAQDIMIRLFSPMIVSPDGLYQGVILATFQSLISGQGISPVIIRTHNMPDLIGLMTTVILILTLIYLNAVEVEIPISYAKFSGFRAKYPVKLLYVSVIPVIFASMIFGNVYYLASMLWNSYNQDGKNVFLNLLGTFEKTEGGQIVPTGGLAYYMTTPGSIEGLSKDPVRGIVYAGLLVTLCLLFAKFWVNIGGLSPSKVAEQLLKAGMQIPGFRRSPEVIEKIIGKYISTVTILGAIIVGLIASVADYTHTFGTGTGLLLLIGIIYQYYQLLVRERLTEMYPALGRLLGES
ncbi:MAG: preprotein translocase subunit SecY [Nitrososphaerota archaeon]|nr:preprotein translocase subunit SecY [Aigarchaeota archaeon]MDW8076885.1 preprotein translocase subunit SecY [Nitrososphaerota archaeon]